jgi:hypothetical protein
MMRIKNAGMSTPQRPKLTGVQPSAATAGRKSYPERSYAAVDVSAEMAKAQARLTAKSKEKAKKKAEAESAKEKERNERFACVDPLAERKRAEERLAMRRSMDLVKERKELAIQQKKNEEQQVKEQVREQKEQRRAEIYAINHALQRLSERKLAEYKSRQPGGNSDSGIEGGAVGAAAAAECEVEGIGVEARLESQGGDGGGGGGAAPEG